MSLLYVNENGATIGVEANKCVVQYRDGMKKMIPIESLEGITIMGQSHLTTKCAEECMCRGISVAYFSKGGKYFGRLMSTDHINVQRQRKQSALYDTDFAMKLGQKILSAKVKNQSVVLHRYEKSRELLLDEEQKKMLAAEMIRTGVTGEQICAAYHLTDLKSMTVGIYTKCMKRFRATKTKEKAG